MSYKALYRRFRPNIFEDVAGQEQVTTILKNQIKSCNIAHAYLFIGTRGTGKTSTAKIFARAVNCINPEDANPCNNCEVCEGILTENIMDVIEIDAASNNKVDNAREIIENVKYAPSKGKYKIYIIDEVHMLSTGAFNALLKTLEEPPSYVIFILATTEPQKIPATILSRCQRFDFKPVKIKDIISRLSFICKELNVDYEEEALRLIAINSEGALRDALSILEQCVSFTDNTLTYDNVVSILGMVNYEFIFNIVHKIAKQDTSTVLTLINEMIMEGKDPGRLIKDLISHFRTLLLVKMNVEVDEILSLPDERKNLLKEQADLFSINQISSFIYNLSDVESKLKNSAQPRALIEIAIVSLCKKESDNSLEGLIERVKELENIIASGEIKSQRSSTKSLPKNNFQNKSVPSSNNKTANKNTVAAESTNKENIEKQKQVEKTITSSSPLDLNIIKGKWQDILEEMRKEKKAQIQALLKEGEVFELKGNALVISFKEGFGFHREALDKEKTKEYISTIIHRITGQAVDLSFVMESSLTMENEEEKKDPEEILKETLPKDINDIIEIIDE